MQLIVANAKLAGVRPNLAESTKIAELANTHNGTYKELRLEDENPEVRMEKWEMHFQNCWRRGEDQVKEAGSTQAHSC